MCEPCTPDALLEAVRGLRVTDPDLGFKPLLANGACSSGACSSVFLPVVPLLELTSHGVSGQIYVFTQWSDIPSGDTCRLHVLRF